MTILTLKDIDFLRRQYRDVKLSRETMNSLHIDEIYGQVIRLFREGIQLEVDPQDVVVRLHTYSPSTQESVYRASWAPQPLFIPSFSEKSVELLGGPMDGMVVRASGNTYIGRTAHLDDYDYRNMVNLDSAVVPVNHYTHTYRLGGWNTRTRQIVLLHSETR